MASNHKLVCARAARQEFAEAFCRGIQDYRGSRLLAATFAEYFSGVLPQSLAPVLDFLHDPGVSSLAWEGSVKLGNSDAHTYDAPLRVMARKRPLLPQEAYHCVSTEGKNNSVVVHDGRVHRDGRTLYMSHSRFCLDRIFNEMDDNATVYREAVQPLFQRVLSGGRASLLLFGQTGTGKTYTAQGVMERLIDDLFDSTRRVALCCYEMAGTRGGREGVFDLLAEQKQVKCLTGEDGNVHVRGAKTVECSTADELRKALAIAFALRSSEKTERNEASSRSHAIIELHVGAASSSSSADSPEGVLRIVDLAGSERNFETQLHTRKMAERGGHINYSLLMLKECARLMHRNRQRVDDGAGEKLQHIPFRSSKLTHFLQKCFEDVDHQTVVITTLSPAPTDVEHTLNSLQHVGMMRASRLWEKDIKAAQGAYVKGASSSAPDSFSNVEGRGHGLHSKLQDARAGQLKLHAFNMEARMGGSIMKKYEPENVKTEAFIDPRWHREMNVVVEEDLWVLREADSEVTQLLTEWHEEQWSARRAHEVHRWDAATVRAFVQRLELPGQVRLPSTMTGAQLCRLGAKAVTALCSDEATAEAFRQALQEERNQAKETIRAQARRNEKIAALGSHRVRAVGSASAAPAVVDAASAIAEATEEVTEAGPLAAVDAASAAPPAVEVA